MNRTKTKNLTKIPLMSAVIAVCSLIAIPMPAGVPITLQVFAVVLSGCILGWRSGCCSVLIYLAIGAAGVPVFSGFTGGAACLFGTTGGYLFGFIPLAAASGIFRNNSKWQRWVSSLAGIAVCHIMGCLWLSALTGIPIAASFISGSAPYILKDILSVLLAFYIADRMRSIV